MGRKNVQKVKVSVTNSFILPCDGGYLAIDTSYEKDYEKYLKGLNALGLGLSDLRYILLTHHHDDHAGMVARLMQECDARIIAHEKGLGPLQKGEMELGEPVNLRVKPFIALIKLLGGISTFPAVVLREEDLLVSGDDDALLREIGIEGKLLHTPGHSSDSITVILDDGNAFVGDLNMTMLNRIAGLRYRPLFVDSSEELFAGWRKVLDAGSKVIYPSHGKPFPAERLVATGWI